MDSEHENDGAWIAKLKERASLKSGERITYLLAGFLVGREDKSIKEFLKDLAVSKGEWDDFIKYIRTPYMLTTEDLQEVEEYYRGSNRTKVIDELEKAVQKLRDDGINAELIILGDS